MNAHTFFLRLPLTTTILICSLLLIFQDSMQISFSVLQDPEQPYVARIQKGTCNTGITSESLKIALATPETDSTDDKRSYSFATTIDVSLDDLVKTPHAVSINARNGTVADTIACGELSTNINSPHRIIVPLSNLNGDDLRGIAIVRADTDETTTIVVFLILRDNTPTKDVSDQGEEDDSVSDDNVDSLDGGV